MSKKQLNHIAFIMDGNGRWATSKNLTRTDGHNEGIKRIPEIILECKKHSIKEISFFAFSTENWSRPKSEISFLIKLLNSNLAKKNLKWFIDNEIALNFIGFNNTYLEKYIKRINEFCEKTKSYNTKVNICFNYGSHDEIIEAIKKLHKSKEVINKQNLEKHLLIKTPVDLLIRTSGEKRISNFMLWQISYAEIIFEKKYWPDYKPNILRKNIKDYFNRDRRFGGI